MASKRFYQQLGGDDVVYVAFETSRGDVCGMSVQYAAFIDGRWRDVIRYDTAHGGLHVHKFWLPRERQVTDLESERIAGAPYDADLRRAIEDIQENWPEYRRLVAQRVRLDPWRAAPSRKPSDRRDE